MGKQICDEVQPQSCEKKILDNKLIKKTVSTFRMNLKMNYIT